LKSGPTVELKNYQNLGYEGKMWFGKPLQQMNVTFDAGSAQSWLYSESLNTEKRPEPKSNTPEAPINEATWAAAKGKGFVQSKSKSYKENEVFGQEVSYGEGKVMGHPAQDKACFDPEGTNCLTGSLSFLSVVNFLYMNPIKGNGVIGLAPTPATNEDLKDPLTKGVPGFIAQLKESSPFDPVFSIYLSNDAKSPGQMTFGGYDMTLAKEGKKS
jgi:hypothetical protein